MVSLELDHSRGLAKWTWSIVYDKSQRVGEGSGHIIRLGCLNASARISTGQHQGSRQSIQNLEDCLMSRDPQTQSSGRTYPMSHVFMQSADKAGAGLHFANQSNRTRQASSGESPTYPS